MTTIDLHQYARLGATARLEQIRAEAAAIMREFPDLRGVRRVDGTGVVSFKMLKRRARLSTEGRRRRKRRRMSAAARKAVSARMKAYWAARRAGAKKR